MLFDRQHIKKMRKWHRRMRPFMYVLWAAPVAIWMVAIIGLSSDSRAVRARDLEVVPAAVSREPASLSGDSFKFTYPCRGETRTVTVTLAQLARDGYAEEQIRADLKASTTVDVGVNSACEIELFPVSQPPLLLYVVITVFMAIVTAVWAWFISFIWKTQGSLLGWVDRFVNQGGN